jgi:hypothetical protein
MNDLWRFSFNVSKFELMAVDSLVKPEPLSDHTLTLAENYLYLFGGSLRNGKISNKVKSFVFLAEVLQSICP